jgi:hypothetical protein
MKKGYCIIIIGVIIFALLIRCSTEPEFKLKEYESKLVIDGWIEQGEFPRVILSNSASYFSIVDSTVIRNLVETKAKVTVSNGVQEEVLTLKRDNRYFPPYVYQGTELRGEVGMTYTLTIELRGKKYTSVTTIPQPPAFNELWFQTIEGKDSLGYIYGRLTDDPAIENYYRTFTQRKNKDQRYVPVYLSTVGDQSFNGKPFIFSLLRGPDSFTNVIDDLYFKKGDTVNIKFCSIDRGHFDFWRTLERELYVVGNPFASSGNEILSNIDNGTALGVWGGYGVTYYTFVVKE